MSKGTVVGIIIALIAGTAIGVYVSNTYLSQAGTTTFIPLDLFPNEEGRIINQNFSTFQTSAYINDDHVLYEDMADTSISITTSGSSYLYISFIAPAVLHIDSTHMGALKFNITLVLNDVTYLITTRAYYYTGAGGTTLEIANPIAMEYVTAPLAAGTYTIKVIWVSVYAGSGNNQLFITTLAGNYSRTLLVQEIHT